MEVFPTILVPFNSIHVIVNFELSLFLIFFLDSKTSTFLPVLCVNLLYFLIAFPFLCENKAMKVRLHNS